MSEGKIVLRPIALLRSVLNSRVSVHDDDTFLPGSADAGR